MSRGKLVVRLVLVAAIILATPLAYAAAMFAWFVIADPFGGAPHPTDEALLAQFSAKRPLLEELVSMIEADPRLERLAPDFMRPEDAAAAGISAERIAAYRQLCEQAGIAHGFSHYGHVIEFIVHTQGLAVSGSAKGFRYAQRAEEDATVIDGDLDAAAVASKDKDVLLERRMEDNWWLYLDMR